MIWVCMSVWCEGGHFTLFATMMSKTFGKNGAMMYGFGMTFTGMSSLFSSILVRTTLNVYFEYEFFFYLSGVLSCGSLMILLLLFIGEPVVV